LKFKKIIQCKTLCIIKKEPSNTLKYCMFRDEARHGKGFEGMLNRYFAAELLKEDLKEKVDGIAKKLGL